MCEMVFLEVFQGHERRNAGSIIGLHHSNVSTRLLHSVSILKLDLIIVMEIGVVPQ